MKAIVYTRHGSPENLQLKEVDRPLLKENQLLIKVHAASLNALDSHLMNGMPLIDWLFRPTPKIPGVDLAGTVEAIGSAVTRFKAGDEVFGNGHGAFAEYSLAPERALALKPPMSRSKRLRRCLLLHSRPCRAFAITGRSNPDKKF